MKPEAITTISFVDQYCSAYQKLFPEVRSFEGFKYLHVGMISELKRKSLPAIAKVVGLSNPQPLHHFLAHSPWKVAVKSPPTSTICPERPRIYFVHWWDWRPEKGKRQIMWQYIGNLGKTENGIVSVNAYGVLGNITFPLIFKIFKPKARLQNKTFIKPNLNGREKLSMS